MSGTIQQELISQLKDKKHQNRLDAIKELGKVGDGEAVLPLFSTLSTAEQDGFWRATSGGKLTPLSAADTSCSCSDVHEAVKEIDDVEAIISSLFGSDHNSRAEAAWALGNYPDNEKAKTKLRDLLTDKVRRVEVGEIYAPRVLLQALRSGRKHGILDERLLVPLLRIDDSLIRWEVVLGLGEANVSESFDLASGDASIAAESCLP